MQKRHTVIEQGQLATYLHVDDNLFVAAGTKEGEQRSDVWAEAVAEELSLLAPPVAGQSLTQRQYIGELRDYVTIRDKLRRVCS